MNKFIKLLKEKDVGAIGIGAMIVFIAMVLVAGIAASVLIQTSTRLESQAMQTGHETTDEVAGGLGIEDVTGHVSTDIDMLAITIRVLSGSPDIDLNHTVIELSNGVKDVVLHFDYQGRLGAESEHFNATVDPDGDLFGTGNFSNLTNEEFGIIVLEDADSSLSHYTPVINRGDLVVLTIDANACFTDIGERTEVFGQVIPEIGAPGVISFTTPSSYSDTVYDLQ